MATPKDSQRFTEIEYCLSRYFNCHILPIMKSEKDALNAAQAKEIAEYNRSVGGILRSFANAAHNDIDDSLLYLRTTGKECSKTAEDYVESCKGKIAGNNDIRNDIQRMACDWRTAVIGEIGRERYDQLSQKLGADLALAYFDHRIEQMMVDRMVLEQMPKSSFDYILRKGASESLFGLAYELQKSPLETEIAERGEAAYKPTKTERYTAKGITIASDTVALGGIYSWGALTRVASSEIVFSGLESVLNKKTPKGVTVDEVLSQAIFGDNINHFAEFRKNTLNIKEYENGYIQNVNQGLSKKMNLMKDKPIWETNPFQSTSSSISTIWSSYMSQVTPPKQETRKWDPNIPLVVAPGHEEEFLKLQETQAQKEQEDNNNQTSSEEPVQETESSVSTETETVSEETNQASWAGWLQSFGLDNISDVGRNLPYVIAMLPDMLVGLLTGKTQSIGLKKDMVPIASILMGMFVSNPLLKMVMIGMGGANLFNKVGHEAIERNADTHQRQYRQYADEELNPRILSPVIRGNVMVATIDGVPCSVTIPDNAAEAAATGALPLNTLANAILARHDSMRDTERDNTRNIDMDTTITRDRGITR